MYLKKILVVTSLLTVLMAIINYFYQNYIAVIFFIIVAVPPYFFIMWVVVSGLITGKYPGITSTVFSDNRVEKQLRKVRLSSLVLLVLIISPLISWFYIKYDANRTAKLISIELKEIEEIKARRHTP